MSDSLVLMNLIQFTLQIIQSYNTISKISMHNDLNEFKLFKMFMLYLDNMYMSFQLLLNFDIMYVFLSLNKKCLIFFGVSIDFPSLIIKISIKQKIIMQINTYVINAYVKQKYL